MKEIGRDEAAAIMFQMLLDCLCECSSNPTERYRVPSDFSNEMADQLTKHVLELVRESIFSFHKQELRTL